MGVPTSEVGYTLPCPGGKTTKSTRTCGALEKKNIKLTLVLIINYGIIIKDISTIMCTVWHVDKYKITFKLIINSRRTSRGPV